MNAIMHPHTLLIPCLVIQPADAQVHHENHILGDAQEELGLSSYNVLSYPGLL